MTHVYVSCGLFPLVAFRCARHKARDADRNTHRSACRWDGRRCVTGSAWPCLHGSADGCRGISWSAAATPNLPTKIIPAKLDSTFPGNVL